MERQKHSRHTTHTPHPQCYHLVEMKIPLKTGGPAIPLERVTHSREWYPLHSGYLFLLYGTKCHLFQKIWIYQFLSKQKNRLTEATKGQRGCAAGLTPIERMRREDGWIPVEDNRGPAVATSAELACTERAVFPSASWRSSTVHLR